MHVHQCAFTMHFHMHCIFMQIGMCVLFMSSVVSDRSMDHFFFSLGSIAFTCVPMCCIKMQTGCILTRNALQHTCAQHFGIYKKKKKKCTHCFLCALSVTCVDPVQIKKKASYCTQCEGALKLSDGRTIPNKTLRNQFPTFHFSAMFAVQFKTGW